MPPSHEHKVHFWIIDWTDTKKESDCVYYAATVTVRNDSESVSKWKVSHYQQKLVSHKSSFHSGKNLAKPGLNGAQIKNLGPQATKQSKDFYLSRIWLIPQCPYQIYLVTGEQFLELAISKHYPSVDFSPWAKVIRNSEPLYPPTLYRSKCKMLLWKQGRICKGVICYVCHWHNTLIGYAVISCN